MKKPGTIYRWTIHDELNFISSFYLRHIEDYWRTMKFFSGYFRALDLRARGFGDSSFATTGEIERLRRKVLALNAGLYEHHKISKPWLRTPRP